MTRLSDYKDVIEALAKDGFAHIGTDQADYGQTLKILVEKDGRKGVVSLREYFYDTDENGQVTTSHGVIDIRESAWWKSSDREPATFADSSQPSLTKCE